ncbi:CG8060 [Drosophila busckii]|uniref:CG8060 n=1 Tax=Drosophila busckii TaxID=30019 RepID=A0A0M5JA82_DROBS|nr:CG8060 [Drosophila busckii]
MSALKNQEYDCTAKCRQRQHGNILTAALTKRSIDDGNLAAFVAKTCANFSNIRDYLGRSAVHMSASVGRYRILEWLLNQGAYINERDFESGSSPLHRALYYGCIDCAVLLLRYGASLELLDEDTRCPLQAICRKCDIDMNTDSQNEILVWGSNKNYNLGIGNEQLTQAPQAVDFFRKSNIWIEHVALGAFHSLFCDKKGHLYAVGHGKGGRLGIGVENSLPAPQRVKVPLKHSDERIICISVSRQHSLLLTNRSLVFACGVNADHQLGVRDAGEQLTTFKEVVALRDKSAQNLLRVLACDQHSIAYSSKCVYVWGANQGQFGISANTTTIPAPIMACNMKLPDKCTIRFVESNNAATVVYTEDMLIFLFYAYKTRVIKTPCYEDLKSIAVIGGNIKNSTKGSAAALKLMMLTETNVVFLWYENTQQFYRQNRTEISREHHVRIDLQRVPNIDRAVDIFCDESFASFAVLQESHLKYFRKPMLARREHSFKKLYHDTSDTDAVHDIVFHVDGECFAAHKFIVFSRAAGLRELIRGYEDKNIYLNFDNLTCKMFELVLKHIYNNYWPREDDIDCMQQSLGPQHPQQRIEVCQMLLTHLEKFGLEELAKYVQSYINEQQFPLPSRQRLQRLQRSAYPELYDVCIVCEDNKTLDAHKCILVARLEYFEMMFMHSWAERATVNFASVPLEYMEPVLDYLYSLDTEAFCKQNYSETFLYNMITLCDQYFITSLQHVCESLILDKISIRKCGEMLDFAVMYNCKLLLQGCLDFICQNLARVLCYRSIEQCEAVTLKLVNEHYRKMFKTVFDYRQITPFSEAIEDELLLSFVDGCAVDLDYRADADALSKQAVKHKQKELHKQDARHYEQQAISSMMRTLSVSESTNNETATAAAHATSADAKSWLRVVDKKDQKRKQAETALKVNNIIKQEEPATPTLSVMSPRAFVERTPQKEQTPSLPNTPTEDSSPLSKSYNLDLSSLLPQSQKLSQKQRKRLSSESQSWRAPLELPNTPIAVPNAWGTVASPESAEPLSFEPAATGSSSDPSSFANMMRGRDSFSKIQADERRQRESYERMRNKSLVHTQIEETAISELREFYNVDNIDDETITIERKSRPSDINFSTWLKH